MELKDLNSPVIWQTLFDGDSKQGWMHSGIGVLSDGRIVFEAPGGAALIFLDPATKKHVRVEVGVAVSHGIAVASRFRRSSYCVSNICHLFKKLQI